MSIVYLDDRLDLVRRLAEAEATIEALLSGQIDAVVDPTSRTPVLLSKAQDALRESEERYRQIVETTSDGIVKIDQGAVITFVNQRFADMLGYAPHEMLGVSLFEFTGPAARATVMASLDKRRQGLKDALDTVLLHRNGTGISVSVAASPLHDASGDYVGSLGIVRDVTEQKRLHQQLIASDRMASVGTLAAGVGHEINNPLAALMVNLEMISDSLDAALARDPRTAIGYRTNAWIRDEFKAPLDDARDAANRVRFIVRDLRIFSHTPSDEGKGIVDVQATMESTLRMAWNEVRHRARLVKDYAPVPGVDVNEARLGQVFLNLIVNAAQAMEEGRAGQNEICVSTALVGSRVVIEVRDTGPGIPPEIIGRIFDPFFTTKAVGSGTGLGLAICMSIVTDMGGALTVSSEVGHGTTFRVSLPVAVRSTGDPTRAVLATPVAGPHGRVLVVDDDSLVLRSIKRILDSEHDVVTVAMAHEALSRIMEGERFDVILCDLMMPDMTGMDLHRELVRACPEQAERMIFVTGGAFTASAAAFLAETPNEHLEKPFAQADLRAMVRRRVH